MRLVSFRLHGEERFGAVTGDMVADLTGETRFRSLLAALQAGALDVIQAAAIAAEATLPIDTLMLLPPIPEPPTIFCVGVNYTERNEEYRDEAVAPKFPSLFLRRPDSFVGHEQPIERPMVSEQYDYEGEIVLIIGKPGRHITEAQALDHVAGLTLANEGSARDWLSHSKFNVTQGKNFDRSGSMGPWMVTADELNLLRPFRLTTRVNGSLRQDDTTARMIFPFAYLIAYFSTFATLRAGDCIVTGAPVGAGARDSAPHWLVPGDFVEIEVPEIGILRNDVVDEVTIE